MHTVEEILDDVRLEQISLHAAEILIRAVISNENKKDEPQLHENQAVIKFCDENEEILKDIG